MPAHLRSLARLVLATGIAATTATASCGGQTTAIADGDPTADGGPGSDATVPDDDVPLVPATKVDVLLVVDDSASMADKSKLLADSLGTLVRAVAKTNDVHLGVISTSLGAMGGDVCVQDQNGRAHLRTTGPDGAAIPAAARGFLAFGGGEGATSDLDAFARDAEALVRGVGERGCGFEAQLESAYRFLVQPDPWEEVRLDENNQATLGLGVDDELLAQRAAFLRPDSLVIVLLVTDEDDSSVDPLALGGQGWAFTATQFPGSTVFRPDGKSRTAPRATSACVSNPASADCTSCGFGFTCDTSMPECQNIKTDPECQKNGGYYGPTEDPLNVRFHRMKERFGVDPQYPMSRYVTGFTSARVPDRKREHPETLSGGRRLVDAYLGDPACTNPLFAASLPANSGDELCDRPRGPRSRELVVFGVLGGVPSTLVDGARPDWTKVLGADPAAYDDSGIDPHMIQSVTPRPGLAAPSATPGDNGPDPIHGREWDTAGDDLQFACTFALPAPRTCTAADPSCDCARSPAPPLCDASGTQVKAKAYPSRRPLWLAKELGDRAVVGSICPADPSSGYEGTMTALVSKLGSRLAP